LEKADFTGKGTAEKARYGKSGVSDRESPSKQFSDGLPQQGPLKQPYPSYFTAQPINRIRPLWENLGELYDRPPASIW